jgi:hypothetical protein
MLEYKFRGQNIYNKKWVYGYLVIFNEQWQGVTFTHHIQEVHDDGSLGMLYRVIPETVGQYTGLKDKNENMIYKDDILRDSLGWTFAVEWDNDNARFLGRHTKPRGDTYICYVGREPKSEIIGNIYENPELLEQEGAD